MFWRKRSDADFRAEIEAHVELEADGLRERGMSEANASAAARRRFGNMTIARERFHEAGRWRWPGEVRRDLKFALRLLTRTPGWTTVALLTAALGIGASVAMFSVVWATWLKPLPFGNPDELYWILESDTSSVRRSPTSPGTSDAVTYGAYLQLRESADEFLDAAAFDYFSSTWVSGAVAQPLRAAIVTASFFETLDVQPTPGRIFRPDEEGAVPAVVILSYGFWHRAFGGDPDILNKTIDLRDGQATVSASIVGIMPASFDFPNRLERREIEEKWSPDIWLPWPRRSNSQVARVVVRARPDASPERIVAAMDRFSHLMHLGLNDGRRGGTQVAYWAEPLREHLVGRSRQPLTIFGGAVVLMLSIACFNIANLLLSRASSRHAEIVVRSALGAPRRRIVQQVLTESLLIAASGGILGVGLAQAALGIFNASGQPAALGIPRAAMDGGTAVFAAGLILLTGLAFGFAPAFSAAGQVQRVLGREARTVAGSRALRRLRQGLLVGQLTFSLTLLVAAGLLARTYLQIWTTDPGLDTRHVITVRFQGPSPQDVGDMVRQLRGIPGVDQVALTSAMPGTSDSGGIAFEIEGQPDKTERARYIRVSPGYFELLRVPLREGRIFTDADGPMEPQAVMVSDAFGRRFFGTTSPIGRRLSFLPVFPTDPPTPLVIVGVVGDFRQHELERAPEPMVYGLVRSGYAAPVLRTRLEPLSLIPTIRNVLGGFNRTLWPPDVQTLNDRFTEALAPRQFNAALIGAFALIAALLAVVGVYGVMSYLATFRAHEMGIRLALGARQEQIVRLIVGDGAKLGVLGSVLGIAGALVLGRFLESMLLNVTPRDPMVFALATVLLLGALLVACWIPGRRVSVADPLAVLRHE